MGVSLPPELARDPDVNIAVTVLASERHCRTMICHVCEVIHYVLVIIRH